MRIGEPSGVADQQDAFANNGASGCSIEKIGMTLKRRDIEGDSTGRFQELQESCNMGRQPVWIRPPQADIQKVPLAKAPAVSFHVGTKVQFRRVFANTTARKLVGVHFKLGLLGYHCRLSALLASHQARNRAKVPARTNHYLSLDPIISDPSISGTFEAR